MGERTRKLLESLTPVGPEKPDPLWDELRPGGHYDREGDPLTFREWIMLFEVADYQRVAFTAVGGYEVSTVWLGLDHGYGEARPVIFETMVFEAEPSFGQPSGAFEVFGLDAPQFIRYKRDFDQRRYATEEEARAGHAEVVREIEALIAALPDPRDLPVEEEA